MHVLKSTRTTFLSDKNSMQKKDVEMKGQHWTKVKLLREIEPKLVELLNK